MYFQHNLHLLVKVCSGYIFAKDFYYKVGKDLPH